MRIVLNTKEPNAVASYAYINALKSIHNLKLNDFENYDRYDVAMFLTYQNDLKEIKRLRLINDNILIGIIDPRGSEVDGILNCLDFLIIDSIEMKDFFSKYQLPIFTYYEYPMLFSSKKYKTDNKKTIIGYHGNKLHLIGMYPNLFKALELLVEKYNIEFWALYNHQKLGKIDFGLPKKLKFKHIQWSEENFINYLPKVDIGVVPSVMPINNLKNIKNKSAFLSNFFNENNDDYIIRFKMPSNPGRILSFAFLGVPVVADIIPSSCQIIKDEYNGFLAYSVGGWYRALEKLILDKNLRKKISVNMSKELSNYEFDNQNKALLIFLKKIISNISHRKKIDQKKFKERDLSDILKFRYLILKTFFKKMIIKIFRSK